MNASWPAWLKTADTSTVDSLVADLVTPILAEPIVHIYALLDPESGDVRYIGKSIRPERRLSDHLTQTPTACHRSHWLESLKSRNLKPDLVILESSRGNWPWQAAERWWIRHGRSIGWRLTNNTSGGDGVRGLPAETRARMVLTWTGRKHRPETIERLRLISGARRHSIETRARMSAAHRGRLISWGARISESLRKLSAQQVADAHRRLSGGELVKDIAAELGLHRTTVSKIKKGTYYDK